MNETDNAFMGGETTMPTALSELDRLRLQNAFLRLNAVMTQRVNIKTQMEVLRRDAATSDTELMDAQAALAEQRMRIQKDYGVDLSKNNVDGTGKFIPIVPSQMPVLAQPAPINGGK